MIDKEDILNKTNRGLDVFKHYIGFQIRPGKNFRNPLYEDKNASCSVYFDRHANAFKMKDFGNDDYSGDCFWLVATVAGLDMKRDFQAIIDHIVSDLHLIVNDTSTSTGRQNRSRIRPTKNTEQCKFMNDTHTRKDYHIEVKPFSASELAFWQRYGIRQEVLKKYNVKSLKTFEGYNRSNESYRIEALRWNPCSHIRETDMPRYTVRTAKCVSSTAGKCLTSIASGWNNCPTRATWFSLRAGRKM